MADLTSTLAITGTVGGRTINIQHTMTLADIYDAGVYREETVGTDHATMNGAGPNNSYAQNSPNYLLLLNTDPHGLSDFDLTGPNISIHMLPNTVAVLNATAGMALETNSNSSIALVDLDVLTSDSTTGVSGGMSVPVGRLVSLIAFTTST